MTREGQPPEPVSMAASAAPVSVELVVAGYVIAASMCVPVRLRLQSLSRTSSEPPSPDLCLGGVIRATYAELGRLAASEALAHGGALVDAMFHTTGIATPSLKRSPKGRPCCSSNA